MAPKSALSMPGEWVPHQRTLTAWPDLASQKNKRDLEGAEKDIAAIANAIVAFEPVTLFCKPKNVERARKLVSPSVDIQELEVDELWIRDTGPVYVKDAAGSLVGVDLNFNYWGSKYQGTIDASVARKILENDGTKRVQAPLVAEGGAIEIDGEGTLLLTESSVVNDNRNPGATKKQLEEQLKQLLGVDKVIWVKGVKGHDITDWHIDAMARFVSPARVLLSRPPSCAPQVVLDAFDEAKSILAAETDARGRKMQVLELGEADAELLEGYSYETCLSYLNYLLVNGGVITPAFGDEAADRRALDLFEQLFPDRKVVQVNLSTLRRLGGGIHCATQQQPKM